MGANQKARDVKQRHNRNEKSDLKLPAYKTKKELFDFMNNECKEYWPVGKVVFIKRSLAFDKEQLCTI